MSRIPKIINGKPATYTIAAPDSINPSYADYQVGAGNSAQNVINQAISDLPASGGKIVLLEGTFTINGAIVLGDNITLEGFREASIITIPNGLDSDINAIENEDNVGGNDNITVKNLSLNLNKANQTAGTMNCMRFDVCYNVRVEKCRTGFARNNGIYFQGGNQLTVVENRTDNNDNNGIYFNNTDGAGIYQNLSYLNGNHGIELNGLNQPSVVSNNACISNTANGIGIYSLDKTVISDNACRNNTGIGIEADTINNCEISDNVCSDNDSHGIYFYEGTASTIDSNNCVSNGQDGFVTVGSDYNTITNNSCNGNDRYGFNIYISNYNNIIGNSARNNSLTTANTYDNFYISGEAADQCEYNNIQENKAISGGNEQYGINLGANATNNQCTNNDIRNGGNTGNFNDVEGNNTTPGNIPDGISAGGFWTKVGTYSDTNTGTVLDLDTGVMGTTYDMYKIIYKVDNYDTGTITVRLRLNGISNAYYYFIEEQGATGIVEQSAEYYFFLTDIHSEGVGTGEYIIRGYSDANDNLPTIHGNSYGKATFSDGNLLGGIMTSSNITQINRIHLTTAATYVATGELAVLGFNF